MIKKFSEEYFKECCDLFIQTFNSSPWNDQWTSRAASKYLREFVSSKQFLGYTAWDNEVLVGAAFCHTKSWYSGKEIFVDEFFISRDYQRQGYGEQLMGAVHQFASENQFSSITLLTDIESPGFQFYEKLGYKHFGHLAFMHRKV